MSSSRGKVDIVIGSYVGIRKRVRGDKGKKISLVVSHENLRHRAHVTSLY